MTDLETRVAELERLNAELLARLDGMAEEVVTRRLTVMGDDERLGEVVTQRLTVIDEEGAGKVRIWASADGWAQILLSSGDIEAEGTWENRSRTEEIVSLEASNEQWPVGGGFTLYRDGRQLINAYDFDEVHKTSIDPEARQRYLDSLDDATREVQVMVFERLDRRRQEARS